MREIKFIITKDKKHFTSEYDDHFIIARHNGYKDSYIIETGAIIEGKLFVFDVLSTPHRQKLKYNRKYIANEVDLYCNNLTEWFNQRKKDTLKQYNQGLLKEGD